MKLKKAQSASAAAALVIILGGLIIIYMLALPADYREALLEDQPLPDSSSTYTFNDGSGFNLGAVNSTLLSQSPGTIHFQKETEFSHPIPAVNLYTSTDSVVIKQEPAIHVKNSAFDQKFKELFFAIPDLENTHNVLLSMNIAKAKGRLTMRLNDITIFDGFVSQFEPLVLDPNMLQEQNKLSLELGSVGWQFWSANEYEVQNLQISAQYTDVSQQTSKNNFIISPEERFNMESAQFEFYPDCNEGKVGKLSIVVNDREIYSAIPACTQLNKIDFSPELLLVGDNMISFNTERGLYSIYNMEVNTRLRKQTLPTYYFDLPEELFTYSLEPKDKYYGPRCGEVDGICPSNCDEDLDRDCCFASGGNAWCDVLPNDEGDRCRAVTDSSQCSDCASGYEKNNGQIVDECKSVCGDDRDGVCPAGCSKYYDRDCCFAEDKENYWCDDVPRYGLEQTCKQSITQAQCEQCPSGYETKSSTGFVCVSDVSKSTTEIVLLRDNFRVMLEFTFFDDAQRKAARVYVNGHKFEIDTYEDQYIRDISPFVIDGSNGIKIEPKGDSLELIGFDVEIEQN